MYKKDFDPDKFVDRELEQDLFHELLTFESSQRILAITDGRGSGKSELLQKLTHRCRTANPRIPVVLIALDQLADPTRLSLIRNLFDQLKPWVPFERYRRVSLAEPRFTTFGSNSEYVGGCVNLSGVTFEGSVRPTVAGVLVQTDHVVFSGDRSLLSKEQESRAEEEVINSFCEDLRTYCLKQPVVLMFDAFSRGNDELEEWFEQYFLETNFFSSSPGKLILVVAGEKGPRFRLRWSAEECHSTVRFVDRLGRWTREHVEQCFQAHGFSYGAEDIDALYRLARADNISLNHIVTTMHLLLSKDPQR